MNAATTCVALLAAAALAAGCAEPCEFMARCDGNVLETCSIGPDQIFGETVRRRTCAAPNPVCVEPEPDAAQCVTAADATCVDGDPEACAGLSALNCQNGFVVSKLCQPFGPSCGLTDEGAAVCGVTPLEACDHTTFEMRCEDNMVMRCRDGVVQGEACDTYDPPRTCGPRGEFLFCLK